MLHRCFMVASCALVIAVCLSGTAFAEGGDPVDVPEIALGSMASAVALLASGGAYVADRIRRKLFAR